MQTFLAPDGSLIVIPKGRVMACGLSEAELRVVSTCLPSEEFQLYSTDIPQDIAAINRETLLVRPEAISQEMMDLLLDYYTEISGCGQDTVVWIGAKQPPSHLRKRFAIYPNFEALAEQLPRILRTSHQRQKKTRAFSKNLADCLMILSLIRANPGIKTKTLSEKLELPIRTVQRYITTLQATGEWIEYDAKKRGWQLQSGISILFGDHLTPEDEAECLAQYTET